MQIDIADQPSQQMTDAIIIALPDHLRPEDIRFDLIDITLGKEDQRLKIQSVLITKKYETYHLFLDDSKGCINRMVRCLFWLTCYQYRKFLDDYQYNFFIDFELAKCHYQLKATELKIGHLNEKRGTTC